jgi:translation initiation factor eIF-2B subunit alpha
MVKKYSTFRDLAAVTGVEFIQEGMTVLVHSFSRVVLSLLRKAHENNTRFKVIVTESLQPYHGKRLVTALRKLNIMCTLIPDSAVGFVMDTVDLVLVGGEAIVQNGGLLNQVGTYQIAVMAQYANKPFYVLAER